MSLPIQRTSIREYTDQIISEEQIKALLTSAMQAPSAMNRQPWEFIVVTEKKILKKMATASKGAWMLNNAPLCISVIMRQNELTSVMAPQDCAAATQNILLEAVHQGLGAVWIGVYPRLERMNYLNKLLNVKQGTVFANIAIGYPAKEKAVNIRYDAARVHYNKVK